jgi:Zn-dependent protease
MDDIVFRIGVWVPVLLLSVTFHEVSHGYSAYLLGDPTARNAGRLTLNPIAHLDPMGLFVMIFTALFLPFAIGWAKPVPVNPAYFRDPAKGMMITGFAGPLANLVIAFVFNLILRLIIILGVAVPQGILQMLFIIIFLNLLLAAFNLVPIPPLDGSRVLGGLIPRQYRHQYFQLEPYGMWIIIGLLILRILWWIVAPLAYFLGLILWVHPEILMIFSMFWRGVP